MPMDTGVAGAQMPHRAAAPQLPRRDIRKAGKLKQTQHILQLSAQLEQQRIKLHLSVQREAAIVSACNAACAICMRFGATQDFTTALVGAVSLALHNLAASDAYVLLPCQSSNAREGEATVSPTTTLGLNAASVCSTFPGGEATVSPTTGVISSDESATDTDKDEVIPEKTSQIPAAYDIFDAEDSVWTAPGVSHAATGSCASAQQLDSGDAAAGASALPPPDTDATSLDADPRVADTKCAMSTLLSVPLQGSGSPGTSPGADIGREQTHDAPQQAPDDVNSRHCGSRLEQDVVLAKHSGNVARSPCVDRADFNSQDPASTSEIIGTFSSTQCGPSPRRDFTSVSQDGNAEDFNSQNLALHSELLVASADTPQRAPDDVKSRHCGVQLEHVDELARPSGKVARSPCVDRADVNSQDLALSSEIIGTASSTRCGPLPRHDKESGVITTSLPGFENISPKQTQCGPLPRDFNLQGMSVADACVAQLADPSFVLNSQSIASSLTTTCAIADAPQQAPEDHHSRHCGVSFEPHVHQPQLAFSDPSGSLRREGAKAAIADTPQQAPEDVYSRHCGVQPEQDDGLAWHSGNVARSPCVGRAAFKSQDLAPSSESIGTVSSTQYRDSAQLSQPQMAIEPLKDGTSVKNELMKDDSAFHGSVGDSVQPGSTSKPRYHGTGSTSKPRYHGGPLPRRANSQSLDLSFGPSTREQHTSFEDYSQLAKPLIAAYRKRRNPSLKLIRATATKILNIAKQHGVSKEFCCQHLQESSLALTTAASDLWSS